MTLITFLILGIIIGGEAGIAWHLLSVIDLGSYSDGALMMGNIFFLLFGSLVGGIGGLFLWLLNKIIERSKKIRFWLINIALLLSIFRILLGSYVIPPIVTYARDNNITLLKIHSLFVDNYDIRDLNQQTATIKASEYGRLEAASFLIKAGAQLDLQDRYGFSALMSSAYGDGQSRKYITNRDSIDTRYCKIAVYLIQYGANINLANVQGENALILAAKTGDTCIIENLLQTNINVNHSDVYGRKAIDYAFRENYKKVVDMLLKAGAKF